MFAAISDRKAIQAAKDRKAISDQWGPQEVPDQPDLQDHRAISGRRDQEVFQVSPAQPGLQDHRARKV